VADQSAVDPENAPFRTCSEGVPGPEHVIVYVVVVLGLTTSLPINAFEPPQPPLARHDVIPLVDQIKVEASPCWIVAGLAVNPKPGVGPPTTTVTLAARDPPGPKHVRK
jgi:hypothetical protein